MEQWEKEYLDTVTQAKKAQETAGKCSIPYEEGYDSSRWVETELPDGRKYYTPKNGVFENRIEFRQSKKRITKRNTRTVWARAIRKGIILFVLIVLLLWMLPAIKLQFVKPSSDFSNYRNHMLQSVIAGQVTGQTYVDGYGFADMMNFFKETQAERNEFANDVVLNMYDLSGIDLSAWEEKFEERTIGFDTLKFDVSYEAYVTAEKEVFGIQKELLTMVKYNVDLNTIITCYQKLAEKESKLRSILILAFEENNIRYSLDGDSLTYWYKQY